MLHQQVEKGLTKSMVRQAYKKKLCVILETLSSGLKIDTQKFENFAEQTAKLYALVILSQWLYVDLYEWHPMSPTMHKILRPQ